MHSKEKDELRQIQELFCLREFIVSSDPRSAPPTAKKPFFLKNHLTRWLLSLWRDSQLHTGLILGDTGWQLVVCAGSQQVVGPGICTETLCIIVIIVRGNLTLSLQNNTTACAIGPFYWALELGLLEQNDQLNMHELSRRFIILPAFDITVQALWQYKPYDLFNLKKA